MMTCLMGNIEHKERLETGLTLLQIAQGRTKVVIISHQVSYVVSCATNR